MAWLQSRDVRNSTILGRHIADGTITTAKFSSAAVPVLAGATINGDLDLNGKLDQDVALVGTGDAANVAATINHATQTAEGIDVSIAQITNVRTSGAVIGIKSTVTSLTGDTAGVDYSAYQANCVVGEAGADHIAFKQTAGFDRTIDSSAAASGEVVWFLPDAAANALTIEDSAGNDFLVIDTAAVDGITLGNATTNPVYSFLGSGAIGMVGGGLLSSGAHDVGGALSSPMTAAQVLTNGATISLPTTGFNKALSSASAVTGIILAAGTTAGQVIILHNINASDEITYDATPATSNVAQAVSTIPATTGKLYTWDATASRWFPVG